MPCQDEGRNAYEHSKDRQEWTAKESQLLDQIDQLTRWLCHVMTINEVRPNYPSVCLRSMTCIENASKGGGV